MKFYRETLTANKEVSVPIDSQSITILNIGPGDLYVNFDQTATIESLLIPVGFGRTFNLGNKINKVHAISNDASLIQIDGLG